MAQPKFKAVMMMVMFMVQAFSQISDDVVDAVADMLTSMIVSDDMAEFGEDEGMEDAMMAEMAANKNCHDCVRHARCVDGKCVCNTPLGHPLFYCHGPFPGHCSLKSDFTLTTFNADSAVVQSFGSSRAADVFTSRKPSGKCNTLVHVWTERVLGKIYIKGVQVHVLQETATGVSRFIDLRVTGSVHSDVYHYTVEYRPQISPNFIFLANFSTENPPYPATVTYEVLGCRIHLRLINAGFFRIAVSCCGVLVGLRPYNPLNENRIPGAWITVRKNRNPYFKWYHGQEPLCLDFGDHRPEDIQSKTGLSNVQDALNYLALTNGGEKGYPNAPTKLTALSSVLLLCQENLLNSFFNQTRFMVWVPQYVKCISADPHQEDVVSVLLKAARWICQGDVPSCQQSQALISSRCAHLIPQIAEIQAYVNASCS